MRYFSLALLAGLSLLGRGRAPRQAPPVLIGPIKLPAKAKAQAPAGAKTPPSAPVKTPSPAAPKPSVAPPKTPAAPAKTQASAGAKTPTTAPAKTSPQAAQPVVGIDPNPCLPGQTVTFTFPAGISRATASGGGFGTGTEIKPGDILTDVPRKPVTYYTFDLWEAKEGKPGEPAAKATPAAHQMEKAAVQVYAGKFPPLATYHDPHHWRIDCLAGWNRNVVPLPDPAENALIYFQPEQDSPERTTVAIVPVKDGTTCADLMQKALADTASQYNTLHELGRKETMQCGVSALWVTLDGFDQDRPNIPVKVMAMGFVRDGKGYVISGRTRKSEFDQKAKWLGCLMRSFAFEPPAQTSGGTVSAAEKGASGKPLRAHRAANAGKPSPAASRTTSRTRLRASEPRNHL